MIKTIVDAHDYNFNFQKNCELNRIARETCEKKEPNLKSKDLPKAFENVAPVKTLKLYRSKKTK